MSLDEEMQRVVEDADRALTGAERLLHVAHVATRLGVSHQFVRELCRDQKLPALRLGRRWRVRPRDLETFIEARKHAA
jgi:excisionase family DNA binding protein